jgi:hypothetical protein
MDTWLRTHLPLIEGWLRGVVEAARRTGDELVAWDEADEG